KGHDTAAVQEQGVNFERAPVIGPGVYVHRERIALVEVDLAAAAHYRVPRLPVFLRLQIARRSDDYRGCGNSQELPACDRIRLVLCHGICSCKWSNCAFEVNQCIRRTPAS